jgi:hypothetical protein
MLQLSRIPADIRARTAHIDGDERLAPLGIITRLGVPDDTSGWSRQDSPQSREVVPFAKPSVGLHEEELVPESFDAALEAAAEGLDVTSSDGCQVGIGNGRVGARHELDLAQSQPFRQSRPSVSGDHDTERVTGTDHGLQLAADRHFEPLFLRNLRHELLVFSPQIRMHKSNRHGFDPFRPELVELLADLLWIWPLEDPDSLAGGGFADDRAVLLGHGQSGHHEGLKWGDAFVDLKSQKRAWRSVLVIGGLSDVEGRGDSPRQLHRTETRACGCSDQRCQGVLGDQRDSRQRLEVL